MAALSSILTTTERERLARRRGEITRLNGVVQAVLRAEAMRRWPADSWGVTLAAHDRVPGVDAHEGGHWTLFGFEEDAGEPVVASFGVTLWFAANDAAERFMINGQHTVWTDRADAGRLADVLASLHPFRQMTAVEGLGRCALAGALIPEERGSSLPCLCRLHPRR